MKEKTVLEMHIDDIGDFNWLGYWEGEEFIRVDDEETIAEAARLWKMTPEAVTAMNEALSYLSATILEHVRLDLKDLYDLI